MKGIYQKFFIEEIFIRSWWTYLFVLIAFSAYEQANQRTQTESDKLLRQLQEIQSQQIALSSIQDKLQLQVNSQSDPYWIELTLIKGLGLIPEGSKKVYFSEREKNH